MAREEQAKEFREEVIAIDRVARVVAGGRRFRFRALAVVGDGKGRVGMGVAKAGEVSGAIQKAIARAKASLLTVPLKNGTIPHAVNARFAGAQIMLKPAGPGTGVIAGGAIRPVLEVAGVTNVLSKAFGSTNKLNNCYATFKALAQLEALPPRPQPTKPKAEVQL
jgi:small subunit ribosomal protein S5